MDATLVPEVRPRRDLGRDHEREAAVVRNGGERGRFDPVVFSSDEATSNKRQLADALLATSRKFVAGWGKAGRRRARGPGPEGRGRRPGAGAEPGPAPNPWCRRVLWLLRKATRCRRGHVVDRATNLREAVLSRRLGLGEAPPPGGRARPGDWRPFARPGSPGPRGVRCRAARVRRRTGSAPTAWPSAGSGCRCRRVPGKPPRAELGLAEGGQVAEDAVGLEHLDHRARHPQRLEHPVRGNEVQVVTGGVVLGELSVPAAHERAHRQPKSGRVCTAARRNRTGRSQ